MRFKYVRKIGVNQEKEKKLRKAAEKVNTYLAEICPHLTDEELIDYKRASLNERNKELSLNESFQEIYPEAIAALKIWRGYLIDYFS